MRTGILRLGAMVGCALMSLGTSGWADGKADEAAVRKVVAKMETAYRNKDVNGAMALSTLDFTEKDRGKTRTAVQARAELERYFKSTTATRKLELKPVRIEWKGGTAVVTTSEVSDITQVQPGPKGKSHRLEGTGTGRMTLVKRNGLWKVKLFEQVSMAVKMDGKPVKTP